MSERGITLLIADSQIDEITALKLAIESACTDCRVVTADQGAHALLLAADRQPSAVLADMRLSDMSGLRLLLKMKAQHPEITTIMMSETGSNEARTMCLEAGVDFFFEKPVDVSRLSTMLGKARLEDNAVFRGTLDQLSVPDVLQLISDRESPMLMRLDSDKGQGAIEILRGEVIHSRINGRVGEQAFFELVSWREGHFEVVEVLWPEEQTIALPLQDLLMRAASNEKAQLAEKALAQKAKAEKSTQNEPFFSKSQTITSAGNVWDFMSHYKRPTETQFSPPTRASSAVPNSLPAFAAYAHRKSEVSGQPLRFKARTHLPPRIPAPDPLETLLPSSRRTERPGRKSVKLPSARRMALAGTVAACILFLGVRYTGLFNVQYGRDLGPAVKDLIADFVPGVEHSSARAPSEDRAVARSGKGPTVISNKDVSDQMRSTSVPTPALTMTEQGETDTKRWPSYEVGVRDDERLLAGANHVGVSADVYDQLNLNDNPWVELRGSKGRRVGAYAIRVEDTPEPLVLGRSFAQALGYATGDLGSVRMRQVDWSKAESQSVTFESNRSLPGKFCDYWYAVGLSLESMKEAGLAPGAYAVIRGPNGLQSVRVQLVDRGNADEIWLSKPVRDAIGSSDANTQIKLFPKG